MRVNEQEYTNWCNEMLHNNHTQTTQSTINSKNILQQLKNFDLVNKTPMQTFEFIAKLKSII